MLQKKNTNKHKKKTDKNIIAQSDGCVFKIYGYGNSVK